MKNELIKTEVFKNPSNKERRVAAVKINKKLILAITWALFAAMCVTAIAALCLYIFTEVSPGELFTGVALARYIVTVSIPLFGICAMIFFIAYRRTLENEKAVMHK